MLAAAEVPDAFALKGAFPTPFRETTRIEFALPEFGEVTLVVYDVRGREIAVRLAGLAARLSERGMVSRSPVATASAAGVRASGPARRRARADSSRLPTT